MHRKRHEKGQAMVEFALVLPVLILLLCGILDLAWIFGNQLMVTYGCREGARYAAVTAGETDLANRVRQRVLSVSSWMDETKLVVTPIVTNGDVTVDVKYTFSLLTPVISTILGKQDMTVSAESVMKEE